MSQKKPRVDSSTGRPSIEECLLQDALEKIMAYLDWEARCTARLVSKTFCTAASAHVCKLRLRNTSKPVSFHRYLHVRHVTVSDSILNLLRGESLAQLNPRLRELATTLIIKPDHFEDEDEEEGDDEEEGTALIIKPDHYDDEDEEVEEEESDEEGEDNKKSNDDSDMGEEGEQAGEGNDEEDEEDSDPIVQARDHLPQAALMPKLRELEVRGVLMHEAALLASCTHLEALAVHDCSISVARTIVTMTQLTSIHFGGVLNDGGGWVSPDVSWLGHLTALKSLEALSVCTVDEALPLIGNLTGLTRLTLRAEGTPSIAPLKRLSRLRYLCIISMDLTEGDMCIASSLSSGCLTSLHLSVSEQASADCGKLLSSQTALTELTVANQLCNLRHLAPLRFEQLQSLAIRDFDRVDAEGLSVLCRATSLTRLCIDTDTCITGPRVGLNQVLARLTLLRSLTWFVERYEAAKVSELPLALSPLTGLTELRIESPGLDDGYLRSLLVLTGLRVLDLRNCRLTDEVLPELGLLTNLSSLAFCGCGVASLAPVSEVLNPLRRARGLRPLYASVCGV